MYEGTSISIISFVLIVLFGMTIVLWLSVAPPEQNKKYIPKSPAKKEGFTHGKDFYVYNYLQKPIRIKSIKKVGGVNGKWENSAPEKFIERLESKSKRGFLIKDVVDYLGADNRLQIFVLENSTDGEEKEQFYAEYKFDIPDDTTVKNLHVGMITARWTGSDGDYSIDAPGLNAVQGLPFIKIHNLTDFPLALNENINISPGGTLRYTGRDHFGVRLGTVFEDANGIFQTYIFTVPATDVYYGVVSDIQQPLFGGFQLDPELNDDPGEPQWLLEEGRMGGPAKGHIPAGFLPIEGPHDLPPQNRWGEKIDPKNIQVSYPTYQSQVTSYPMPAKRNDPQDWVQ